MQQLRKRWLPLLIAALVIGGPVAWYKWPATASAAEAALVAPVKQGTFKVVVTTTGELRARKFVQVTGPAQAQAVNVYQSKISSLIPEGSVVKAGDVIAELDRGPIATKNADVTLALQKAQAEFTTAQLDSALNLAVSREEVRTAEYTLEEKKIAKEQAQYEAPSIKRQAEIDFEKAQRALAQSKRNLETKTKQAVAKMSSVGADLGRQQNQLKAIQEVMTNFTIRAPTPGMVIYIREWNGKKKGVGSQWNTWDNAVATLPDLSQMESQTYVNEVDVRKLTVGQPVQITLDADPSKRLPGKVTEIANVGEQRPNQDSKVFEVKIELLKAYTTLRPGMTTANAIETSSIPNSLSVPLEALVSEGGYSYVYKKDGRSVVKQMIETGIKTITIPGLKPIVAPTSGADTAKSVTLPGPAAAKLPGAKTPPAPIAAPVGAKPKG
jgi:multidrug efflux pump subunit AcrA (membrane-fusion protein)